MKNKTTIPLDAFPLRKSKGHSKLLTAAWSLLLFLALCNAGCKKNDFVAIQGVCPTVVTDPMDKAVDVVLGKVITATFNTPMDASTINDATFTIMQGTTLVTGKVAATADAAVFTFTPDVPLLPYTVYTGTIAKTASDKLHTQLPNAYVWSFTTIPQLTLTANPVIGGTVKGAGVFASGSAVTAAAMPATGYTFANWTENGTVVSTSPNYQFTLTGNRSLVANFTLVPLGKFAVVTTSNPMAGGTTAGFGSYTSGSSVTVNATPSAGYTFVNWTIGGVPVSTSPGYTFVLTGNTTLVANFLVIPATQFAVILSSNPAAGGATTGSGSYNSGTSVTVTAIPNAGYNFTNWTVNGAIVSTSPAYTFPLTANRTLVANFTAITYTLTVTAVNGTVVANPNQPTYASGSTVQLTATPNTGYTFTGWTGDATGVTNPLTVTMNSNKNITANFTANAVAPLFTSIFGALGGAAGVTNQGINTVINNGAIGTTGASTLITGFHDGLTGDVYTETPLNIGLVTGGIYTAPPAPGTAAKFAIVTQAVAAANAFYLSISPANKPGGTDPGAGELGGLTLIPGVYKSAGGTFAITNGNLTLDAGGNPNAVWIFQAPTSLTVGIAGPAGARSVTLINGAQAKNVYWYVGTAATINAAGGGVMVGTIISSAGVTFSTAGNTVQTVLDGQAISLVASITMVNTTINVPQ